MMDGHDDHLDQGKHGHDHDEHDYDEHEHDHDLFTISNDFAGVIVVVIIIKYY